MPRRSPDIILAKVQEALSDGLTARGSRNTLAKYQEMNPQGRIRFQRGIADIIKTAYDRYPGAKDLGHFDLIARLGEEDPGGQASPVENLERNLIREGMTKEDADYLIEIGVRRVHTLMGHRSKRALEKWKREFPNSGAIEPGDQRVFIDHRSPPE